jgi:hypothetical protein
VQAEPVLRETARDAADNITVHGLRADIRVQGLQVDRPLTHTFLDLVVSDVDASTYQQCSLDDVFAKFERDKRVHYAAYCRDQFGADFAPFIMSHDGALAPAADKVIKEAARRLAAKPNAHSGGDYERSVRWLRARLQLGALRHSSMCLRASRFKWRSVAVTDGAAWDYLVYRDR